MTQIAKKQRRQRNFNSHPHEEDDGTCQITKKRTINISTHILTKRMTVTLAACSFKTVISTHILTKRMTIAPVQPKKEKRFQLTSSRRGWLNYSIHAWNLSTFQLTSSRRGWQNSLATAFAPILFQLTSSRRGWQSIQTIQEPMKYFNSHPHEEDDEESNKHSNACDISTHILTKRMTIKLLISRKRKSFQLTSSRRGWPAQEIVLSEPVSISTHILTKRMTEQAWQRKIRREFQLTSSRRGWPMRSWHWCWPFRISTHILTKRMTVREREDLQRRDFNSHPHEEDDFVVLGVSEDHSHFNSHPHEEDDQLES